MAPPIANYTGQKTGHLLILGLHNGRAENYITRWDCLCSCGRLVVVKTGHIKTQRSCGCSGRDVSIRGEYQEGVASPEIQAYRGAMNRCNNPKTANYSDYGGRGIEFRFSTFGEFLSCVGRRPSPQHSLNRIDNNGHYEAGNLEWATQKEQMRNTRATRYLTLNGVTLSAAEWLENTPSLTTHQIYQRVVLGWCDECTLTQPTKGYCSHLNRPKYQWGKSGHKYIGSMKSGRFRVNIYHKGVMHHRGYFSSLEDAITERDSFLATLHTEAI